MEKTMMTTMKMRFIRVFLLFLMLLIAVPGTLDQVNAAQASKSSKTAEKTQEKPVQTQHQFADDQVNVFYCTSCGFHQNFLQVKQFLEDKYPHLIDRVYGANLEPEPMKNVLAQLLGYIQLGCILMMIMGEYIFNWMGWDQTYLQKALDNRIGCFAVILLLGTVSQNLISTGGFEIYYNNELIFSRIAEKRWPTLDELSKLLEARGINDLA